jgi:hypothetical protein
VLRQGLLDFRPGPPRQPRDLAASERRRGRRPGLAVPGQPVGAELGAEGDQRRQVADRLDRAGPRDPNETVRVEVVAEQERRVRVGRREQTRPAVVEQVALVDRLEPERVALFGERGEDGLALGVRAQRLLPEPALEAGLGGDRPPEIQRYSQPASSFVQ